MFSSSMIDRFAYLEIGRESSVAAEDFVVDNGGDGKTVKTVSECLPKTDAESLFALFVKTVDAEKDEEDENAIYKIQLQLRNSKKF